MATIKLIDLPEHMQAQAAASLGSIKKKCRFKRHKPGQMNKTEEAWAVELEKRRLSGEVLAWWFEGLRFRLADNTGITPDFLVLIMVDGEPMAEMHEVKALWKNGQSATDDSLAKLKIAAEQYWPFGFLMVYGRQKPKKEGGGWEWKERRLS